MASKLCQELLTVIFEECLRAGLGDDSTLPGAWSSAAAASGTNNAAPSGSDGKRHVSAHGTLCTATRVCKKWNAPATKVLYSDPGPAISRYEGLYLPPLLAALKRDKFLRDCVRALTITASLEAALWISDFTKEGDVFCDLIELCPRLKAITVPSFEKSCRARIIKALQGCHQMESFNIRVYLESSRRDPRFKKLIPYDSWKLEIFSQVLASWPKLKSFTVRHIPDNSYHLIPDIVLQPPKKPSYSLTPHSARLTTLSLRETFIDDQGLFHLLQGSVLTTLCLMSCQGITSSAITRAGMLKALEMCGPTLANLTVMTPWLPHAGKPGELDLVLDKGLRFCPQLRSLCVAGYDVTNAFLRSIPNPQLLQTLEVMDFELVSPQVVFEVCGVDHRGRPSTARSPFSSLKQLAVWQRNAGVGRARVSNGWFKAWFARPNSPAIAALEKAGIRLATGWESRLISGSPIEYMEPRLAHSTFEELDRLSPV